MKYLKCFENFNNDSSNGIENYLEENWSEIYDESRGNEKEIIINGDRYDVMGEMWDESCIGDYLVNNKIKLKKGEEYEDYLGDAINDIVKGENWDGYVYIEPHISGEVLGVTIFYRKKSNNKD